MNLSQSISLYCYGTPEGAEKGWDKRGRSERHQEYGKFQGGYGVGRATIPGNRQTRAWVSPSGASVQRTKLGPTAGLLVTEYGKNHSLVGRAKFDSFDAANKYLEERYGIKQDVKAATVKRINNPAPVDGPELYETKDEKGNVLDDFEDEAGAQNDKERRDRKKFKLKESKLVRKARRFRDGQDMVMDERQRRTTMGGPGNG